MINSRITTRFISTPVGAVIASLALVTGVFPAVAESDRFAQQPGSGVETQGPNLAPKPQGVDQNQTQQAAPTDQNQGADTSPESKGSALDKYQQRSTSGVERSTSGTETQGPNLAPRTDQIGDDQNQSQQSAPVNETQGTDNTPQAGEPVPEQTQASQAPTERDRDFPRLEIRGPNFAPHIVYE